MKNFWIATLLLFTILVNSDEVSVAFQPSVGHSVGKSDTAVTNNTTLEVYLVAKTSSEDTCLESFDSDLCDSDKTYFAHLYLAYLGLQNSSAQNIDAAFHLINQSKNSFIRGPPIQFIA